ncbi:MAG: pyridoxamine 5'-phosphate oxidase [Gammaproteobacteria bacterium]
MKKYYANLRRDYHQAALDESNMASDPVKQFEVWLNDAIDKELELPNAMVLATVTEQGRPAARYVLLKELDANGFVFFTHSASDKGRQLANNAFAALVFYWGPLHRQVRVEGSVTMVTAAEADAYFATRPYGSRLAVWTAPQSDVIPDRAFLQDRMQALQQQYPDQNNVPRPDDWTGYRLRPDKMEFWQGQEDRLHDRIAYTRQQDGWLIQRLAP